MTRLRRRQLALAGLVLFTIGQVYAIAFQDGGGWLDEYGIPGAFVDFFDLSLADPLLTAGLVDFMMLTVIFGIWMLHELPAGQRWGSRTYAWIAVYLIYPALGALLYLLWLRPDIRLMQPEAGAGGAQPR